MGTTTKPRRTSRRALELLAGTALGLSFAAQALAQDADEEGERESIVVIGERAERQQDSSIAKLTQPIADTPQSISLVSEFDLESRAVSNLNDALRAVPGVTLGAGEFSWQGNSPTIRGFVARSDMFLDGMRDFGNYYRDPFNLQQIEVLEGPSSIYFGRGSTGGVINQTSKQPTLEPATEAKIAAGTEETYRATVDIDRPLTGSAAVRVTAMAHHNQVAGRDVGENSRWGVAPSLALGLGTPTRLTASYLHQSEDNVPDYGIPWYFGRPAPVDPSSFYGYTSDHLDTDADIGTARVEHDVSPALTVRDQIRTARYSRDFRISEAVLDPAVTPATPLADAMVYLNIWSGDSTETFFQNQLDMVARFDTGSVGHTLVFGVEAGRETSKPVYKNSLGVPEVSLVGPDPSRPFVATNTYVRLAADTTAESAAVYALDTLRFSERWEATLGARWDRFDADYKSESYSPAGDLVSTAHIPQVDEKPSVRAALVYKPTEGANLYAAFGTSFNPSAENLTQITSGRALGTGNANLDPEENQSYELGTKLELPDSDVVLSGSVFRLEKSNARVPDPDNPGFAMLGGEQRVDGLQLQVVGDLTDAWYVRAGYTYLDSEVVKSSPGGPPVGRPLLNAPENSASLLTEYRVTPAFTAGLSATYLSERYATNGANPETVDGYATVDAMARYAFSPAVSVQLNVFNLGDETYFDQLHPWHVVPGAGRSALVTLEYRR